MLTVKISDAETLTLIASHLDSAKRLILKSDLDSANRSIRRAQTLIKSISTSTIPGITPKDDAHDLEQAKKRGDVTDTQHPIPGTKTTKPEDPITSAPAPNFPRKATRSKTFIPTCVGHHDMTSGSVCLRCACEDPCKRVQHRISNDSDFAIWWREASIKERSEHMKDVYKP